MSPVPPKLAVSGLSVLVIGLISLALVVVSLGWLVSDPLYVVSPSTVKGQSAAALTTSPSASATSEFRSNGELHIALVFDQNRLQWPQQVIRSVAFHTNHTVHAHLIMTAKLRSTVGRQLLDDSRSTHNIRLHFYDIALCEQHTRLVSPFAHPECPSAVLCKPFLAAILPTQLERVLLIDSDATAVQDVRHCYEHPMSDEQQVAMGVDMGEICQQYPDRCWPIGFSIAAQSGLRCGTPLREKMGRWPVNARCPAAGDLEPFQFNGGVMLLNLANMRRLHWVSRFVQVAASTARDIEFKQARWCEQDLTNNFFRVYPSAVSELSCGCNYQFGGLRRDLHCPKQPIYFAHAWHAHVKRRTNNSYNSLFYYWLADYSLNRTIAPPPVHDMSGLATRNISGRPTASPPAIRPHRVSHGGACPLQPLYGNCSFHSESEFSAESKGQYGSVVNVLTRLAGNAPVYLDMRRTVLDQTYPYVRHVVLSAGHDGLAYGDADVIVAEARDTVRRGRAENGCKQVADDALRELHKHVVEGWVLYLAENQLLSDSSTIAVLLAHAKSTHSLLVWNINSSTTNAADKQRQSSDELTVGGFMFHSSQLANLTPDTDSNSSCQTLTSQWAALSALLIREPVDIVSVLSHPNPRIHTPQATAPPYNRTRSTTANTSRHFTARPR